MAYIEHKHCHVCEKTTHHCNRECSECRVREKREKTAVWNSKSVDEKLRDLRKRIEILEAGPQTY